MMNSSGNVSADHLPIYGLLTGCSLGFDVGHKTGAVVNNSGTAVEMWG